MPRSVAPRTPDLHDFLVVFDLGCRDKLFVRGKCEFIREELSGVGVVVTVVGRSGPGRGRAAARPQACKKMIRHEVEKQIAALRAKAGEGVARGCVAGC